MKEQIEVITYEQDRLNYFTNLMNKAQKRYRRLFKKYKEAPILSDEYQQLGDAGRETQFFGDVVEMLEKGYRKQEWISVDERVPKKWQRCLCYYPEKDYGSNVVVDYAETDNGGFAEQYKFGKPSHWMPLPEAPKGGAE